MNKTGRVFISYDRNDSEIAASLRQALRAEGLNVWWDEELRTGQHWADAIDGELMGAKAIVALWSRSSIESDWVRHEASIGKVRGILTHARIEPVEIPVPFRSVQVSDLTRWNNRESDPEFRKLVDAIAATNGRPARTLFIKRPFLWYALPTFVLAAIVGTWLINEQRRNYEDKVQLMQATIDELRNRGQAVWRARVPLRLRDSNGKELPNDVNILNRVSVELEPPTVTRAGETIEFSVINTGGTFPNAQFKVPDLSRTLEVLDLNDSKRIFRNTDKQELTGIAPIWLKIGQDYSASVTDQSRDADR